MDDTLREQLAALEADGCTIRLSPGALKEMAVTSSGEGMATCSISRDGCTATAHGMTQDAAAMRALDHWERMVSG